MRRTKCFEPYTPRGHHNNFWSACTDPHAEELIMGIQWDEVWRQQRLTGAAGMV